MGGLFFAKQCLETTVGSVRISATIRVPTRGLLPPPLLASKRIPVVNLSSNEEVLFTDTSRDEDFAMRLFSDLNHGLLGPSSDSNIIIINDSVEEEEAREDDIADTDAAPPSTLKSLAPTTSAIDVDDTTKGVPDDSNNSLTPGQVQGKFFCKEMVGW
jgi:hypothetical protein